MGSRWDPAGNTGLRSTAVESGLLPLRTKPAQAQVNCEEPYCWRPTTPVSSWRGVERKRSYQ